jgi:hypothetical protein
MPTAPAPPPQRPRSRDIPQEDLLVPPYAGEARIVVFDREVQDLVAVRGVALDQAGLGDGRVGFERVVEVDEAVCAG